MRKISEESFQNIVQQFAGDAQMLYSRLRIMLTPEECATFARFDRPEPNFGTWSADVPDNIKSLREATPQEAKAVVAYLTQMQTVILPKLKDMPQAEHLFKVPSNDEVFFYTDADGRLRVVLAQWGYRQNASVPKSPDVYFIPLFGADDIKPTQVVLHIKYTDGALPPAGTAFVVNFLGHEQTFTVDEEGAINLGTLMSGQEVSVSDGENTCSVTVAQGVEDYAVSFTRTADCTITVADQLGRPLGGTTLLIDGQPHTADAEGRVSLTRLPVGTTLRVEAEGAAERQYTIAEADNHFTYTLAQTIPASYDLTVVDQNGQPVPAYPITIDGRPHTTDQQGRVAGTLEWTDGRTLHAEAEHGTPRDYALAPEPQHYIYNVEIPEPEPEPVTVRYILNVTDQRGNAMAGYPVSINGTNRMTDPQGRITSPEIEWEEGMQFHAEATDGEPRTYTLAPTPEPQQFSYQINIPDEPEHILRIRVFDHDGTLLAHLPVTVVTRGGKTLTAVTDGEGYAHFPKDEFQPNEKIKVKFSIKRK